MSDEISETPTEIMLDLIWDRRNAKRVPISNEYKRKILSLEKEQIEFLVLSEQKRANVLSEYEEKLQALAEQMPSNDEIVAKLESGDLEIMQIEFWSKYNENRISIVSERDKIIKKIDEEHAAAMKVFQEIEAEIDAENMSAINAISCIDLHEKIEGLAKNYDQPSPRPVA